jgi:uncharacterized protein YjbI with pentapeptide repeats
MDDQPCPFCAAPNPPDAKECQSCKRPFPWASAEERITNAIKERETNRVRATMTLIEDLYGTLQKGKASPLSSLKGLIFSLLFPKAILIVGSIFGGALLAVQTAIIYQQYKLQEAQNSLILRQTTIEIFDKTGRFKEMLSASQIDSNCKPLPPESRPANDSIWAKSNQSATRQIVRFAQDEPEASIPAIESLLNDDSGAVSSGAFAVLTELRRLGVYQSADRFAKFSGATMHLAQLENQPFPLTDFSRADLTSASMQSGNFSGSFFLNANLKGAHLSKSKLKDADFTCADMSGADLADSNVEDASFDGANLAHANMAGVQNWKKISSLTGANVRNIKNPPDGFLDWAIREKGAILFATDSPTLRAGDLKCQVRVSCE